MNAEIYWSVGGLRPVNSNLEEDPIEAKVTDKFPKWAG